MFFFFLGEIERAIFEYFWFRNKIFHLGFLKSQFSILFKKLGLSIQIPIFNLILISKSHNFIFPPRFSQKFQFDMHLILWIEIEICFSNFANSECRNFQIWNDLVSFRFSKFQFYHFSSFGRIGIGFSLSC